MSCGKRKAHSKQAYLELQGETLIREARAGAASAQSRGSTDHLLNPTGGVPPVIDTNKRPYTAREKEIYKLFNPDVTEEQLSKLTKEKIIMEVIRNGSYTHSKRL